MIVDRIRQKACSWSSKFLSLAGKVIMLKSVLAAMPSYTMSCFKLPNSLYKRIQSALTRFWWDDKMDKKKMCWVSWKKLTNSKREGGLGFRDLQSFNDALLAKVSWRLLTNPSSLLARTLLGKYCHSTPFIESRIPSNTSHGWRGICIGRDLLKTKLGRVIGDGKSTRIWHDPWLSLKFPSRPMGPAPESSHNLLVAELLSPVTLDWDREKIQKILPEWEETILEIKASTLRASDSYAWLPSKNSQYSAKSGYYESLNYATEPESLHQQDDTREFNWTTNIWNIKCSPKTKFFLWKVMKEALPLGVNLKRRNINLAEYQFGAVCPFCGEEENALHLFFKCNYAQTIWDLAPLKISINCEQFPSFRTGLEASKLLTCLPPSGISEGPLLPWIVWTIWLSRNQKIFNDRTSSPMETLSHALSLAREWQQAQSIPADPTPKPPTQAPRREVSGDTCVCYTDAAWIAKSKAAGFGWTFTNRLEGSCREGSASSYHIRSALTAEAVAIHSALQQALSLGIKTISIASDAKQVIEALNSEIPPVEFHGIHHDILNLSLNFSSISFNFIPREQNRVADAIAKSSLRNLVSET